MLYFGMPAAFVETTDIWLEPRRRRLAVTWSGPFTGLILGGAAALAMVAFPTAPVNNLLFKLAGLAYFSVFINVNPLLKLDGYYLLTDALDITSLREKSLFFVRKRLFGKLRQRKKFTRDEAIFTIFGVLSLGWTLYAIFLALFFWRTRVSNSLQAVLGAGYPLLTRFLSLLLLAALVSFLFLIVVQFFLLGHTLIDQFARSGGLAKHARLALILAGVALGLGIGLPLIFPSYVRWILAVFGLLAAVLAAFKVIPFSRPYLWSRRGLAYLAFGLSIFLGGLIGPVQWLPNAAILINWAQWASLILLLAGFALVIWPPQVYLQLGIVLAGLLIGGSALALLGWLAAISLSDARLWGLVALFILGVFVIGSLWGSARSPAMGLFCLGGLALGLAWFFQPPFGDFLLVGIMLLAVGGLHLVYARLPTLTTYRPGEVADNVHWAIGESLGILVRRAIAQMYFEAGTVGVEQLGRAFSSIMHQRGVNITIQGKTVDDCEMPNRSTHELADIYSLVMDELHRLVCREIGLEKGTLTFGYGIDLLPWEHREIVSEYILSRQSWGLALRQSVSDARQERRKLLRKVPLFTNCMDNELDRLASSSKAEQFASGETIISQGSLGDRFYIIERGLVTIWKTDEEGVERKVVKLGRGQYFGEAALVSSKPRNATVRAETPLALLSLDKKDFDRLVRQYLDLADQVDEHVRYSWLLREMPIFDELDYADLENLSKLLETEHFRSGQVVFSEGDCGDKFYIVESGAVSVTQLINGKQVELSRRRTGEYVGEIALLQDCTRTATITALEETTLLSLTSKHFHFMVSRFLSVGEILSRTGTRRLSMDQRIDAGMFTSANIAEV
jgi:putative peptide zinc metalloprotease protein